MESPAIVRVTNNGDKVFKDSYANIPYEIKPGSTSVLPWEAVATWLGDPRLVDRPDHAEFDRRDELARVLIRLGAHIREEDGPLTDEERVDLYRPHLAVADIDGNEIVMLAEDPTGETNLPAKFTRGDQDDLFAELDKLKRDQAHLLDLINERKNDTDAPGLDEVLDDVPTKVGVEPEL